MKKAIVLLSGGLDSTTCLGVAKKEGYELYALSFDYGQKHKVELGAAKRVAEHYGVKEHLLTRIGFESLTAMKTSDRPSYVSGAFEGSALVDPGRPVPKDGVQPGVAPTYVPGRNMIFLSFAAGWADSIDAAAIFIGVNALDFSGYPDCRPAFIHAMDDAVSLGTRAEGGGITIRAPLIHLSKKAIVELAMELEVPLGLTHSCYDPQPEGFWEKNIDVACGKCDSCRLRLKGFEEAGLKDPVFYKRS